MNDACLVTQLVFSSISPCFPFIIRRVIRFFAEPRTKRLFLGNLASSMNFDIYCFSSPSAVWVTRTLHGLDPVNLDSCLISLDHARHKLVIKCKLIELAAVSCVNKPFQMPFILSSIKNDIDLTVTHRREFNYVALHVAVSPVARTEMRNIICVGFNELVMLKRQQQVIDGWLFNCSYCVSLSLRSCFILMTLFMIAFRESRASEK